MTRQYRQLMQQLHTWAGVSIGALLLVIFWMGTLSVFDREIDRWMQPETRKLLPDAALANVSPIDGVMQRLQADSGNSDSLVSLYVVLPSLRQPFADAYVKFEQAGRKHFRFDIESGNMLPENHSYGATEFFFPMHYRLFISGNDLGYFLVGLAAMAMLVLIISGLIIHRKIFTDFFTFRPWKRLGRSSLDLHNMSGVLVLPFHIMISLSGLVIFASWYASLPWLAASGVGIDRAAPVAALYRKINEQGRFHREPSQIPAAMASIDDAVKHAEQIWAERYGGSPVADSVSIDHVGDANATVSVQRLFPKKMVAKDQDLLVFDGVSGELLFDRPALSSVFRVSSWLGGLHFIQFDHWLLRWLYFFAGMAGCVMIATGFIFWLASRKRELNSGVTNRVVEAISITSVSGLILATSAFFVANRSLTDDSNVLGMVRADLEVWAFFIVWMISMVHAILRRHRAWSEQLAMTALLSIMAVGLNWVSTGDHLWYSLNEGLYSVAGVDSMLIFFTVVTAYSATKIYRKGAIDKAPSATLDSSHMKSIGL